MAEKKTNWWKIAVIGVLTVIAGAIILTSLGLITLFPGLSDGIELPDAVIEPEPTHCRNIHLYNKYVETFGHANMTFIATACEALNPGGWQANANEVSCDVDGRATLACPGTFLWGFAPATWKTAVLQFRTQCNAIPGTTFTCSQSYMGCEC